MARAAGGGTSISAADGISLGAFPQLGCDGGQIAWSNSVAAAVDGPSGVVRITSDYRIWSSVCSDVRALSARVLILTT
jgi:hypothetical protein